MLKSQYKHLTNTLRNWQLRLKIKGWNNTETPLTYCSWTLSWRRPLSYRNQSIDLRSKSMDWFLYDNGLRHERVNIFDIELRFLSGSPAGIYLFKFNNGNTKTLRKICSKLTIKAAEQRQWRRSGIFIVKFKKILHIVLFSWLILNYLNTLNFFHKKVPP